MLFVLDSLWNTCYFMIQFMAKNLPFHREPVLISELEVPGRLQNVPYRHGDLWSLLLWFITFLHYLFQVWQTPWTTTKPQQRNGCNLQQFLTWSSVTLAWQFFIMNCMLLEDVSASPCKRPSTLLGSNIIQGMISGLQLHLCCRKDAGLSLSFYKFIL